MLKSTAGPWLARAPAAVLYLVFAPNLDYAQKQVDGTPTPSSTQAQTSAGRSLARTTARFCGDAVRAECRAP